jgi:hypothetical protein
VDAKARGIAIAPHRPLIECRLDLAMASENLAVPADEQQRAIHGAFGRSVTLGHADDDVDAGAFRRLAKRICRRARNLDGVVEVFGHRPPGERAHWRVAEERIAGKPGLAEASNGGAHRAGFPDQATGLFRRRVAVEGHGGSLDRGEPETLVVGHGRRLQA